MTKWRFELYGYIEAATRDEAKQKVAAIAEHLKSLEEWRDAVYSGNIVNPVGGNS